MAGIMVLCIIRRGGVLHRRLGGRSKSLKESLRPQWDNRACSIDVTFESIISRLSMDLTSPSSPSVDDRQARERDGTDTEVSPFRPIDCRNSIHVAGLAVSVSLGSVYGLLRC